MIISIAFILLSLITQSISSYNFTTKFEYYKLFRQNLYLNEAYNRDKEFNTVMKNFPGAYLDPIKSKSMKLDKTVIFFVIVLKSESVSPKTKFLYINNMICHFERLGLFVVLYTNRNLVENVTNVLIPSSNIIVMPYPDELFWNQILNTGRMDIAMKRNENPPLPYPTYNEYNDGVIVLAFLELLRYGYSALYFDDDYIPVTDPMPFLSQTTSDVVTAEEIRVCSFVHNIGNYYETADIYGRLHKNLPEMNLAFTFFRPSRYILETVQRWFLLSVMLKHGQKAFQEIMKKNMIRTFDCDNRIKVKNDNNLMNNTNKGGSVTICFLPVNLYQNGFINSVRCGSGRQAEEFSLLLAQEILLLRDKLEPNNTLLPDFSLDSSDSFTALREYPNSNINLLEPFGIHYNFDKKPKIRRMISENVWLLDEKYLENKTLNLLTVKAKEVLHNLSYYNVSQFCDVYTRLINVDKNIILTKLKKYVEMRKNATRNIFQNQSVSPYYYFVTYDQPIKIIKYIFQFDFVKNNIRNYKVISFTPLHNIISQEAGNRNMKYFNATIVIPLHKNCKYVEIEENVTVMPYPYGKDYALLATFPFENTVASLSEKTNSCFN